MTKTQMREVALPDGRIVNISDSPQPWWTSDGIAGFIDPKLLAPDPDQPRKHMNNAEFLELRASVKERGVRENIVVTPRSFAPWIKLPPEHDILPFVIVGGHRRDRAAIEETIPAVPIIVRIYQNRDDHRLDGWLLNKDRADLSPLEEGREIVRLNAQGISLERLAKAAGASIAYIQGRRNLTQLLPGIQALIEPTLAEEKRLGLTIACALGGVMEATQEELEQLHILYNEEVGSVRDRSLRPRTDLWNTGPDLRRFELQKVLLAVIRYRELGSVRAVEFISQRLAQLSSASEHRTSADRFEPNKRKQILMNLAQGVQKSKVLDWTPGDFERTFEDSEPEEVHAYMAACAKAANTLADIAVLLKRCMERKDESKKGQLIKLAARGL